MLLNTGLVKRAPALVMSAVLHTNLAKRVPTFVKSELLNTSLVKRVLYNISVVLTLAIKTRGLTVEAS